MTEALYSAIKYNPVIIGEKKTVGKHFNAILKYFGVAARRFGRLRGAGLQFLDWLP